MAVCNHYYYDNNEKRNISLVKQIRKHVFECKQCKVTLHDVDVNNLNNYLRYINNDLYHDILKEKADIYEQLKPIPRDY